MYLTVPSQFSHSAFATSSSPSRGQTPRCLRTPTRVRAALPGLPSRSLPRSSSRSSFARAAVVTAGRSRADGRTVLRSYVLCVQSEAWNCVLDRKCLALRASGLWLRYATLQNLIPSFPWIAQGWRAGEQSKERKGSKFAAKRSGPKVQKPEGPNRR